MKLIVPVLLMLSGTMYAQVPCTKVWLKGKVEDTLVKHSFLNLMVVNTSTGEGVFGQPNGTFGVYVSNNDSIVLSVKGYERYGFRVVGDSSCQFEVYAAVERKARQIEEVVIKPLKSLQEIKEERADLAMRETRTITGLEAFQSPITALYERFSKREQSKAIVARKQYEDKKEEVVQELLRLYVSYDIIKLKPDDFIDFIHFMAMDENFLKTASDIELVTYIKDKLEHYMLMHPEKE
ncbi:hypothetical protein [Fluviicola sp.]|uniref:hypothetical protein n=1 Tax=Fluviicola sp. TaxID=1917219 RepID=UPI00261B382E|nr:hypothetical protein [Fluviicola sp.]